MKWEDKIILFCFSALEFNSIKFQRRETKKNDFHHRLNEFFE